MFDKEVGGIWKKVLLAVNLTLLAEGGSFYTSYNTLHRTKPLTITQLSLPLQQAGSRHFKFLDVKVYLLSWAVNDLRFVLSSALI